MKEGIHATDEPIKVQAKIEKEHSTLFWVTVAVLITAIAIAVGFTVYIDYRMSKVRDVLDAEIEKLQEQQEELLNELDQDESLLEEGAE